MKYCEAIKKFKKLKIAIIDYDVFSYRPEMYDTKYEHVWKWDSNNYGGIRLIPKRANDGIKQINKIVCKKSFDTLHTKSPAKYFDNNPYASHVWCVDKEYKINEDINWAPDNFEPNFIHSFHLRGQLEHKYPAEEGGIKLYPRDWKTAYTKFHKFLDANVTYPILYVKDVNDMQQRDILPDEYVWLIDQEHRTNIKTFDWIPNPFEQDMLHVFRMPYQLTEKYPMAMGGIRLVPKKWKEAETKIHPACPIEDESYDVFYIDDDEFTVETYTEYAERSKTDWFWIVDREFDFNGKLLYVPAEHEKDFIHVFKLQGHLEERYPPEYTDAWDIRCGGIRLIHKNFDITNIGPQIENHKIFPERCNVTIAKVINKNLIKVKVWERGAGLTKACGTAACATAFAAKLNNLTDNRTDVEFETGKLSIFIDEKNSIHMKGPVSDIKEFLIKL